MSAGRRKCHLDHFPQQVANYGHNDIPREEKQCLLRGMARESLMHQCSWGEFRLWAQKGSAWNPRFSLTNHLDQIIYHSSLMLSLPIYSAVVNFKSDHWH